MEFALAKNSLTKMHFGLKLPAADDENWMPRDEYNQSIDSRDSLDLSQLGGISRKKHAFYSPGE